jgi:hypothetical protein
MGALKPWHLAILSVCCLVPLAAVVAGAVWAVLRRRNRL